MAAPLEVILSSDSGSQLWNLTVFDLHSGSSLLSYRGGNSSARTLAVLCGQYLMSAQLGKNFINVWEVQRKVQNTYSWTAVRITSASALGTSVCMTNIFVLFGVQDQLQQKIVCPGVVTCLNASPDGRFLAAAVGEAVYLWEVRWSFVYRYCFVMVNLVKP